MEFKAFLLCFAVLVVATSAASVCKCEDKKESVYKYELKIKDGDKAIEEDIEIDTEKQTETYHIPKKDSGNGGEVDILYDFKQNLTMHRISSAKACFLSKFDEIMPNPSDLVNILDQKRPTILDKNETKIEYQVVSTLTDRSDLSDEMASMCAKLPIYRIEKSTPFSVMVKRVKRQCTTITYVKKYYCGRTCIFYPFFQCWNKYCDKLVMIRVGPGC